MRLQIDLDSAEWRVSDLRGIIAAAEEGCEVLRTDGRERELRRLSRHLDKLNAQLDAEVLEVERLQAAVNRENGHTPA